MKYVKKTLPRQSRRDEMVTRIKAYVEKTGSTTFMAVDVADIHLTFAANSVVLRRMVEAGMLKVVTRITRPSGARPNVLEVVNLVEEAPVVEELSSTEQSFEAWRDIFPDMFIPPNLSGNSRINRIEP